MKTTHPCARCGRRCRTHLVVVLCTGYDRGERVCSSCAKDPLLFATTLDGWDWWFQRSDRLTSAADPTVSR